MTTPSVFENRRSAETRLVVLKIVLSAAVGLLLIGFWLLQIVDHAKYREIADNHYLRTLPLRAPRGVLFDRQNRVLVENRLTFTIQLVRERSADIDRALVRVAEATGVNLEGLREEVRRAKSRRDPLYRPVPLVDHATLAQVGAVLARKAELPEVVVQQVPTRSYPPAGLAAHLFGYVGEISDAQIDRPEYSGLLPGAVVGQSGIEKTYNQQLMGEDGSENVVVNSQGRELDKLKSDPPTDGQRLQLTIDLDLQHAIEDAFKMNNFAGAAMLLDPRNGEVLGMTSQPSFDPNDFAGGIGRVKWTAYNTDPMRPLTDRLLQGHFSPGSTFKIVMALAALSEGLITPDTRVYCSGQIDMLGRPWHCDKREGHGSLDLRQALAQSCDIYFYKLASMMSIDTIHDYAAKLGLEGRTGIDLPNELESVVPSSEWKLKVKKEKWYAGDTISVGIGQGLLSDVTPVALATMIAAIANGGTVVTPHVVKAIDDGTGWKPVDAPGPRSVFPIKPDVLEVVRDGLWQAVNGEGTAGNARVAGHDVVGKTGTAQTMSLEAAKAAAGSIHAKDNSWFVFYAPRENPEIAGVVFTEHGGWGATAAAPIANYLLEMYFAKKEGRPLPKLTVTPDGMTIAPKATGPRTSGGGGRPR